MIALISSVVAGFILRAFQVVIESSPYLLIGFCTAGALRAMVPPGRLRAFFETGSWSGLLRAWAAATLLPICALGVLPILREFRRAGVGWAVILTFALAGPMLGPVSIIHGFASLGPGFTLALILGSFVVSVGTGAIVGYFFPKEPSPGGAAAPDPLRATGSGRLAAAGVHAAWEMAGPGLRDVAIGLAGAALTAAVVSPSFLAESFFASDHGAIPKMAAVAPTSYLTPDQAMAIVPQMVKFRESAGAAFLLVILGAGMTLGHASWLVRERGPLAAALGIAAALGLAVVAAVVVDRSIAPVGTANPDNDHKNALGNASDGLSGLPGAISRYAMEVGVTRWLSCGGLVGLAAIGLVSRRRGEGGTSGASLGSLGAETGEGTVVRSLPAWDRPLPPRFVGVVAASGLAAVAVVGAMAFFPSPADAFDEMQIIKADLFGELGASAVEVPLHHLDLWERQVDRLPIGATIRLAPPGPEARRDTEALRDGIAAIRRAVRSGDAERARSLLMDLLPPYERCRKAYRVP